MDINSKNLMIIIISILMLYLRKIVCSAKGEDEDIEIKNSTTIRTVKTTIRDIIPTTIIKSSQIITQTTLLTTIQANLPTTINKIQQTTINKTPQTTINKTPQTTINKTPQTTIQENFQTTINKLHQTTIIRTSTILITSQIANNKEFLTTINKISQTTQKVINNNITSSYINNIKDNNSTSTSVINTIDKSTESVDVIVNTETSVTEEITEGHSDSSQKIDINYPIYNDHDRCIQTEPTKDIIEECTIGNILNDGYTCCYMEVEFKYSYYYGCIPVQKNLKKIKQKIKEIKGDYYGYKSIDINCNSPYIKYSLFFVLFFFI